MGRNKAFVEVDGVQMCERVVAAVAAAGCDPIWIAGGDPRLGEVLGCPVLVDPVAEAGPLAGVTAALIAAEQAERAWVAVVAADLPLLTPTVVARLIAAATPSVDVVVARTDRLQPAAAIWSVEARGPVERMLRSGARAVYEAIGALRHVEVTVARTAMRNVNTPDDLAALDGRPAGLRDDVKADGYPLRYGDS